MLAAFSKILGIILIGTVTISKYKSCDMGICVYEANVNSKATNKPVEQENLIRPLSYHILQYQIILLAGPEGPDQPADLSIRFPHMSLIYYSFP